MKVCEYANGNNAYLLLYDCGKGNAGFETELQEECSKDPVFAAHVKKHHKGNSVGLLVFDSRRHDFDSAIRSPL